MNYFRKIYPVILPIEISYEVFENVRCSACKHYLNCPPIIVYPEKDGYTECGRCYNEETAKESGLHLIRNTVVETLADLTPFPCKYTLKGCQERRIWPAYKVHEAMCIHRPYKCPCLPEDSCSFEGNAKELAEHFQQQHADIYLRNRMLNLSYKEEEEEVDDGGSEHLEGKRNCTVDCRKSFETNFLLQDWGCTFLFQVKYDNELAKLWFSLVGLNMPETTNMYIFSVEFKNQENQRSVCIAHSINTDYVTKMDITNAFDLDLNALNLIIQDPTVITCSLSLSEKGSIAVAPSEILQEIKCPVCYDYMKDRIYMCNQGHNVCSKCKEFVTACPVCREAMGVLRNHLLEKMIVKIYFSCSNVGCRQITNIHEIDIHEENCLCPRKTENAED